MEELSFAYLFLFLLDRNSKWNSNNIIAAIDFDSRNALAVKIARNRIYVESDTERELRFQEEEARTSFVSIQLTFNRSSCDGRKDCQTIVRTKWEKSFGRNNSTKMVLGMLLAHVLNKLASEA